MNILVIGNGFDLAHGLETKYTDFLDFTKYVGVLNTNYKEVKEYIENNAVDVEGTVIEYFNNDDKIDYLNFKKASKWEAMNYNKGKLIEEQKWRDLVDKIFFDRVKEYNENEGIKRFADEEFLKCYQYDNKIQILEVYDVEKNFWIKHFIEKIEEKDLGKNWIDFEKEISEVISSLEFEEDKFYMIFYDICEFYNKNFGDFEDIKKQDIDNSLKELKCLIENSPENNDKIVYLYNTYLTFENNDKKKNDLIAWRDIYNKCISYIIRQLQKDLDNLILLFEIYLKRIVQKKEIKNIIYDIENIGKIDKVLSFNYTNTFKKIYDKNEDTEINFIHGKCRDDLTIGFNNMVLGIDDYNIEKEIIKIDTIYFKKYFQRIWKSTGVEYKKWLSLDNINSGKDLDKESKKESINIYFFGHSLDFSDEDILKELINNERTKITIFYNNRQSYSSQIKNLVNIIGKSKLLEYAYIHTKKIEFKEQECTQYYGELKKIEAFENYKKYLEFKLKVDSNKTINDEDISNFKEELINFIKKIWINKKDDGCLNKIEKVIFFYKCYRLNKNRYKDTIIKKYIGFFERFLERLG